MKKIILCLITFLALNLSAFAEEPKVFTDDDLGKYKKSSQPIVDEETIKHKEADFKKYEQQSAEKKKKDKEATLICKKVRASINVGSHPNPYAGKLIKITSNYYSREAPPQFPVKVSATVTNVGEAGEISLTLGGGWGSVYIQEVHVEGGETKTLIGTTELMSKAEFDNIPAWECLSATRYNKETRLTTGLEIINE